MPVVRSNHCVYDTHYHIVLPVKYRKALLSKDVVAIVHETLAAITERYDIVFEQVGDDKNHIHVLASFHPKYSIGQVVKLVKGITARQLFLRLPYLKKELWGGEFWSDGYYVGTIGTGANWSTVERYVRNQGKNSKDTQLTLWH